MIFKPLGRNIVINTIKKEEEESAILLPTDYRPADLPYEVVRVGSSFSGHLCEVDWKEGELIVVEAHLIRQFDYEGYTYYLIAENHVIGRFQGE